MKSIIVIEKNSTIKTTKIREYNENELYRKAGFKNPDGFKKHTVWKLKINKTKYMVHMFGKTVGRAGQENKYDFPPPVDETLFFGSCILVCKNEMNEICNLTEPLWKLMYETLFGGFEDLGNEDSEEELDTDEDENIPRTKEGYVKDGFIVDDDDDDEDEDDDEDDDEDEDEDEEDEVKFKKSTRKITTRAMKKVTENVFMMAKNENNNFTCTDELSEESYDDF